MSLLRDKIVVVTGASSGIGKAISVKLSEYGVKLCLTGRRKDILESVAKEAAVSANSIRIIPADLNIDEDIYNLAKEISINYGRVDILIHSAGVVMLSNFLESKIEDLDLQYRINLRAPYILTKSILPFMVPGPSQIIFINSSAAINPGKDVSQYAATKGGLKAVADSLRSEINDKKVRVLSVYPGRTATPMQKSIYDRESRKYRPDDLIQPTDIADIIIASLLMPFTAEVTDIQIRPFKKS